MDTTTQAVPQELTHFLVMTRTWPGGWARSTTEAKALSALRGDWNTSVRDYGYTLYRCHPDTYVTELANISYPRVHPPVLIKTVDGRKVGKAVRQ